MRFAAKLLVAGNKHAAGARARAPSLTATHLKPYSELRSWQHKQECDEMFLAGLNKDFGSHLPLRLCSGLARIGICDA
jgi:hypothetical protein